MPKQTERRRHRLFFDFDVIFFHSSPFRHALVISLRLRKRVRKSLAGCASSAWRSAYSLLIYFRPHLAGQLTFCIAYLSLKRNAFGIELPFWATGRQNVRRYLLIIRHPANAVRMKVASHTRCRGGQLIDNFPRFLKRQEHGIFLMRIEIRHLDSPQLGLYGRRDCRRY